MKKGEKVAAPHAPVSLEKEGIREVQDLQEWILKSPEVLGEDLLILTDQVSPFEGTRDRPDIICLDRKGHIVVVELKRTGTADYADLQSLRYAAMLADPTLEKAARMLSESRRGRADSLNVEDAKKEIQEFLPNDDEDRAPGELQSEPRIIIASPGFSKPLLNTVLFLRGHKIDVTCIALRTYRVEGDHYILVPDVVIPVPGVDEFLIRIQEKEQARQAATKAPVSRDYWEQRSSKESMQVVDSLLKILTESDEHAQLHYVQSYIRPLDASGKSLPVWIHPEKDLVEVHVRFSDSQRATPWKGRLEEAGLNAWLTGPDVVVRFQLRFGDVERSAGIVKEILKEASKGG